MRGRIIVALGTAAVSVATASVLAACTAQAASSADVAGNAGDANTATAASSSEPIIDPAYWKDAFPNEYNSYVAAGEATYAHGPGASGKVNACADVMDPPADYPAPFMTGCLSCHSSGYQTQVVDVLGADLFSTDTETVKGMIDVGVSCYSCHENTPGSMQPVNEWVLEAAEKGGVETSNENMVCGQCHSMGDFTVQFSDADSSKWSFLQAGLDPDDMWAYLMEHGNQTPTVPSAEITFNNYLGSTHDVAGATCADCHMENATDESGAAYTKHAVQSVGTNEALYENCLTCHNDSVDDRKAALAACQQAYATRIAAAQSDIDALSDKLAEAEAAGASAEAVAQATELLNKATFYLAYGSDQSQGFHNMGDSATAGCCESAAQFAQEGLALLA